MLITDTITWLPINWPTETSAASTYAVFVNTAATPTTTAAATTTTVTYDDSLITIFVIRPTDGTNYGPAQSVVRGNGQSPTRGWLRSFIRKRTTDRIDQGTTNVTVYDDEINEYVAQAVQDYSLRFPLQKTTTITLIEGGFAAGARDYQLPSDFREAISVRYTNYTGLLQLWLKPLTFKGGETTAGTLVGYPKLGILVPPTGGRFYGGHYDLWNGSIHLDFDPRGDGDSLEVRYRASMPALTDDVTPIAIPNEDLELLALFTESKVWEEIEGKDVNLSRWRSREDGGRRSDLPTEVMSQRIRKLYECKIQERLALHPKRYRLVRT